MVTERGYSRDPAPALWIGLPAILAESSYSARVRLRPAVDVCMLSCLYSPRCTPDHPASL